MKENEKDKKKERERERESNRETHTERQIDRDRETEKERDTCRQGEKKKQPVGKLSTLCACHSASQSEEAERGQRCHYGRCSAFVRLRIRAFLSALANTCTLRTQLIYYFRLIPSCLSSFPPAAIACQFASSRGEVAQW